MNKKRLSTHEVDLIQVLANCIKKDDKLTVEEKENILHMLLSGYMTVKMKRKLLKKIQSFDESIIKNENFVREILVPTIVKYTNKQDKKYAKKFSVKLIKIYKKIYKSDINKDPIYRQFADITFLLSQILSSAPGDNSVYINAMRFAQRFMGLYIIYSKTELVDIKDIIETYNAFIEGLGITMKMEILEITEAKNKNQEKD